jgi:hypothetical protein
MRSPIIERMFSCVPNLPRRIMGWNHAALAPREAKIQLWQADDLGERQ